MSESLQFHRFSEIRYILNILANVATFPLFYRMSLHDTYFSESRYTVVALDVVVTLPLIYRMSLHDTYFSEARYSVVALDVCMCSKAQAFFCIAGSLIATFASSCDVNRRCPCERAAPVSDLPAAIE